MRVAAISAYRKMSARCAFTPADIGIRQRQPVVSRTACTGLALLQLCWRPPLRKRQIAPEHLCCQRSRPSILPFLIAVGT